MIWSYLIILGSEPFSCKKCNICSNLLNGTTVFNEWHIDYQTQQLLQENRETYIFQGICYKENSTIPIIEESAKLKIAKNLANLGKNVIIKDIEELILEVKKEYGSIFKYEFIIK